MTLRERNIQLPLEQIREFCRRNPIRKLSLFGSVLRDDFAENSDVDFLVEFLPDRTPGLIRLLGMRDQLQDLIGRTADLRTPLEFNDRLRREIQNQAETIYAAEN